MNPFDPMFRVEYESLDGEHRTIKILCQDVLVAAATICPNRGVVTTVWHSPEEIAHYEWKADGHQVSRIEHVKSITEEGDDG